VIVGSVAYQLAPEYKFPVLPYDAYDSVRCVGILGNRG
jgi:acetyl esterase/lipase